MKEKILNKEGIDDKSFSNLLSKDFFSILQILYIQNKFAVYSV